MSGGDNPMASPQNTKARGVLYAYLISLLVPVSLFLDALVVLCRGVLRWTELIVLVGSLLWLAAAGLAIVLVRDRARFLSRMSKPLLALYSVCFTCALVQVMGSLILPEHQAQLLFEPGTQVSTISDPKMTPGLAPKYRYTINDVGLRGPSIRDAAGAYKIITVGGSTTESADLDDTEEWPHLLMERLNAKQKKVRVWVANAGLSGLTSVHHLDFVRRVQVLSQANMLTFLIGAADLEVTLSAEGAPTQAMLEAGAAQFYIHSGVPPGSLFRRLYIYRLTYEVWRRWRNRLVEYFLRKQDASAWLAERRHMRQVAPVLALPSLDTGLREYQSRILALAEECKIRGIRCVFLTQPSMVRPDLTPAEQSLLWFGWVGKAEHPRGFLSLADLDRSNAAYNQELLQVCREHNLECYDLASHIPKDTTAFYDDYHFNRGGARMVADFIAQQLLKTQPFDSR